MKFAIVATGGNGTAAVPRVKWRDTLLDHTGDKELTAEQVTWFRDVLDGIGTPDPYPSGGRDRRSWAT